MCSENKAADQLSSYYFRICKIWFSHDMAHRMIIIYTHAEEGLYNHIKKNLNISNNVAKLISHVHREKMKKSLPNEG